MHKIWNFYDPQPKWVADPKIVNRWSRTLICVWLTHSSIPRVLISEIEVGFVCFD